jgi:phosphatidylserine/phosphatidylglycerophosphate/cardiolipin synthase-like enzyme
MVQPDAQAVPASELQIPVISAGSYPARHGNAVRPLVDSGPTFRRICEAIEAARYSVWVAVTFLASDFEMPGGRGTVFDVLDRAVERGLDVRVIFWRPNPESSGYGRTFSGSPADRELLRARSSRFRARWDRAAAGYCQHQKSWLIDAGQSSETAFIGGINPTFAVFEPGHRGDDHRHDVYVEVAGPSATDVHHNFVQRWNEASERAAEDGAWGHTGDDDLSFPAHASGPRGDSLVQIQRNLAAGRYSDGRATPGGHPYDIAAGERTIFEQYGQAIDAARRSIHIENQALPVPVMAVKLEEALKRGVDVALLVPAEPENYVRAARQDSASKAFFDGIEALGRYENFALLGIAGENPQGGRSSVYVHGKIMLIDDIWATIGSCNLHSYSLFGNTEMNASFWDPKIVRTLRCELLAEHMNHDTSGLDDRAAFALCRTVARQNRRRREAGDADWQGLAFSLDPATYGM